MRLSLATLVVFYHCFQATRGSNHDDLVYRWTRGYAALGDLAVDAFFVISGYLITQSWERSRSLTSFVRKRASRIYPGYLLAVAIGAWVVGPWSRWMDGLPVDWRPTLRGLVKALAFQGFDESGGFLSNPQPGIVVGTIWSIRYEVGCYLGTLELGLLGLLGRRRIMGSLFALAAVAGLVVTWRHPYWYGGRLGDLFGPICIWVRLLPFYLAGTVAYLYRDRIRWDGRVAALAFTALAAGSTSRPALAFLLPTAGAYLVGWLAFTSSVRIPAPKFGDLSYGVYLFGFTITQVVVTMTGIRNPYLLFAVAIPPTIIAASVSWHLVERRFLNRSRVAAVEASRGWVAVRKPAEFATV